MCAAVSVRVCAQPPQAVGGALPPAAVSSVQVVPHNMSVPPPYYVPPYSAPPAQYVPPPGESLLNYSTYAPICNYFVPKTTMTRIR